MALAVQSLSLHPGYSWLRDHFPDSSIAAAFRNERGSRIVCVSSSKRQSRKKTNAENEISETLVKDLQEFIAEMGLPPDKVPTTKDLIKYGRQDLANAVRRRGYKTVSALLVNSTTLKEAESDQKVVSITDHFNPHLEETTHSDAGGIFNDGQNTAVEANTLGNVLVPSFEEPIQNSKVSIQKEQEQVLQDKAANFVRTGDFDIHEDANDNRVLEEKVTFEDGTYNLDNGQYINSGRSRVLENNVSGAAEVMALQKASMLRSKLWPVFNSRNADGVEVGGSKGLTYQIPLGDYENKKILQPDNETRLGFNMQIRTELENIKSALHSRERELTALSRELEEAKAQLALVQAKTTAELAQAKQAILEKDIRLQAAEQALACLKQVKVEWWGEADHVELAGSFNGWQHFILLEADPSSKIPSFAGSREQMMWGTDLWLYPGIYEIKFIVDGQWTVDNRREIVLRNGLQNNILRVDL